MVLIDTVYQRVLAIANKEQRGYITPQEFNIFANQAQMDIFEQYFYDINQFSRVHGNETETSDMLDLLNEKLDIFEEKNQVVDNAITLPTNPPIYRLGSVFLNGVEAERVNEKDYSYIQNSPLMQPRNSRPVYVPNGNGLIRVFGHDTTTSMSTQISGAINDVTCNYIRRPADVNWSYTVVNGQALYNGNPLASVDFELHPSEETNLVLKILQLSGLVMKDAGLYQATSQEEIKDIQQEKQ